MTDCLYTNSPDCGTHNKYANGKCRGAACKEGNRVYVAAYREKHRKPKRELKPCGTPAAWYRHRRHGEVPCEACRLAKNREQNRQSRIRRRMKNG